MATERNPFVERPNRFPWPPVIYVAALIVGALLGRALPSPWFVGMTHELLLGFGIIMILVALGIDVAAMTTMHNAKTTILPHRGAHHLVTKGVFSISRNPIYVANTMLVIGAGLMSGIAWYFPLAFIAAFATQKLAIEREERHLETHFGKAYRDYKKRVNRWI